MNENNEKNKVSDNKKWIKIYQHGCKKEPVRGYVREECIPGYAPGVWFVQKATVIGHREMNIVSCEEDMSSRVRFWELYYWANETRELKERPEPYDDVQGLIDGSELDANMTENPYFSYYFKHIGRFIGIVDTKKKAYQMADRLFEMRRIRIEENKKAIENVYNNMNIGLEIDGLDALPFD